MVRKAQVLHHKAHLLLASLRQIHVVFACHQLLLHLLRIAAGFMVAALPLLDLKRSNPAIIYLYNYSLKDLPEKNLQP